MCAVSLHPFYKCGVKNIFAMRIDNKLFNPASQPKELLIENFVVRTKVFEKIFKDIQSGKMKYPEQHYLVQGLRGMGKTTLLLRLKYEVEENETLNNWLIPVFFNEESYDLSSLSNLWEKLLKYLDDYWGIGSRLYDTTEKFIGSNDYEKLCFDLLIAALHERKQKLLILFDNFGELFLDNLKEKETHRLREILMHCNDIRIVAASAIVLEDQHDYSKPFFEFFRIIYLDGLNKDETLGLITKLQEKETDKKIDIEKNKAKIETLALLTGGVIRTILLLYEVLLSDENGTALRDLDIILDRITPLYKHRMDALPVQQRKIVDVVAKSWDAVSVNNIKNKIRNDGVLAEPKNISAQLAQLEKNNVIEKKETTTKNNLYQLKERFFNIWYLMRNGDRYDKCRVEWLTKSIELLYSDDENGVEGFINNHIEKLKKGNYHPESALLILEAINNSKSTSVLNKIKLFNETKNKVNEDAVPILPQLKFDELEIKRLIKEDNNCDRAFEYLKNCSLQEQNIYELLALHSQGLAQKDETLKYYKKLRELNFFDFLIHEALTLIELKQESKAEKLLTENYKKTKNSLFEMSSGLLAFLYFTNKKNKNDALELVSFESYFEVSSEVKTNVLLWNNKILEATEEFNKMITTFSKDLDLTIFLILFIAKKQYHTIFNLFNNSEYKLKDKYKLIYYALMHFMKAEYPNEYLKMGTELEPAVKKIIDDINQVAIDYA
jgi:Fe2+ or Zn2+ uptake regulation protein